MLALWLFFKSETFDKSIASCHENQQSKGIGICRATIPSNYQERYADLYDRQSRQKAAKAIGDAAVTQQIMVRQQATAYSTSIAWRILKGFYQEILANVITTIVK